MQYRTFHENSINYCGETRGTLNDLFLSFACSYHTGVCNRIFKCECLDTMHTRLSRFVYREFWKCSQRFCAD